MTATDLGMRWFGNAGPVPLLGLCPHQCKHEIGPTLAFGPDNEHHRLVRCDDECKGRCRGWLAEYDAKEARRKGVPTTRPHGFREVAV